MKFSRFGRIDERFENKGNPIDSVKLLRDLHKYKDNALTPLTNEQRWRVSYARKLELSSKNNDDITFNISPTDYRKWSKFGTLNRIDEIFKNIDNLYQVSGNVESVIRKCVSGLSPRISRKNYSLEEPLVSLDIVSSHANAASQINIPLGIPKRWSIDINIDIVDAAYLLIDIHRINKYKKYPAVKDLKLGHRYVDLITLHDLVRHHGIEYSIIDGIYFNEGSVNISKEIHEIFAIRKTAKLENNAELADQIKKELNINLYGKLMKKQKAIESLYFDSKDEAYQYLISHKNAFQLTSKNGKSIVQYYKRYTNNYNLLYVGCSILSKAREIINKYIYELEESGVEVIYSNVDSIFIRKSDLDKFSGTIGDELGMFHYEYENIIKALFVDKGSYILKLSDGRKIIRDTYKKMKNIDTNI